jgi:hypothetical protein
MYETRKRKPIPSKAFASRLGIHLVLALSMIGLSLMAGMLGYTMLENLSIVDAFLNAAMLLGGMGPVNAPVSVAGKVFAGIYALYAGLVFIVTAALIFTPIAHRVLHKFHWESEQ